jgi:hypothetical protein
MRLTIWREDAGHLGYEGVLTRAETCDYLGVIDPSFVRSEAVLTVCSCCKRALIEPSGWLELEDAAVRLGLFEKPKAPGLNYTVCPGCANVLNGTPGNDNAA